MNTALLYSDVIFIFVLKGPRPTHTVHQHGVSLRRTVLLLYKNTVVTFSSRRYVLLLSLQRLRSIMNVAHYLYLVRRQICIAAGGVVLRAAKTTNLLFLGDGS
jgi:hypothetical protein